MPELGPPRVIQEITDFNLHVFCAAAAPDGDDCVIEGLGGTPGQVRRLAELGLGWSALECGAVSPLSFAAEPPCLFPFAASLASHRLARGQQTQGALCFDIAAGLRYDAARPPIDDVLSKLAEAR